MERTEFKNFQFYFVSGLSDQLEELLVHEYKIDELDIEDIFTNTQLPKREIRKSYLYVALHFPSFDDSTGSFVIKEIHCIVNNDAFLLIDKDDHKHAIQFNRLAPNLYEEESTPYDLFFEALDFFVTRDFRAISRFKGELNDLEQDIFKFEVENDLVKDILILKRNLSTFYSTIVPLSEVVNDLQKTRHSLSQQDIEKLDDTLDKLKKMINNLDTMIKHADLLSESNNALIAQSTNEVIRILTSISIIAIIPTMISGFFGMNVYFGWDATTNMWPLIGVITLTIALTGSVYIYFKRRGWI